MGIGAPGLVIELVGAGRVTMATVGVDDDPFDTSDNVALLPTFTAGDDFGAEVTVTSNRKARLSCLLNDSALRDRHADSIGPIDKYMSLEC